MIRIPLRVIWLRIDIIGLLIRVIKFGLMVTTLKLVMHIITHLQFQKVINLVYVVFREVILRTMSIMMQSMNHSRFIYVLVRV